MLKCLKFHKAFILLQLFHSKQFYLLCRQPAGMAFMPLLKDLCIDSLFVKACVNTDAVFATNEKNDMIQQQMREVTQEFKAPLA